MITKWLFFICCVIYSTNIQELTGFKTGISLRQKRGLGSFLGKVTKGCKFYPNICTDEIIIERLKNEIKHKKEQLNMLFFKNGRRYVNLKQAATNNEYLAFYMNKTIDAVDELVEMSKNYISSVTGNGYASYSQRPEVTADTYMTDIVWQLEAILVSMERIVMLDKESPLLGIAVQIVVESLVNRFMQSFSEVYGTNKADDFYKTQFQNMFLTGKDQNEKHLLVQTKLMFFVFQSIGNSSENLLLQKWKSLKHWSNINSWHDVKSKYLHTIQGQVNDLDFRRNFGFVEIHKEVDGIDWVMLIASKIKKIGFLIIVVQRFQNWRQLSQELANARQLYENYNDKLSHEINVHENMHKTIDKDWYNLMKIYKRRMGSFRNLLLDLNNHADFNDLFGIARHLTTNLSHHIPQSLEYIDEGNLLTEQAKAKGYLKTMQSGFNEIREELNLRTVMFRTVRQFVMERKPISYILKSLINMFKYMGGRGQLYGLSLTERDVICSVVLLFPRKTHFDFHSLQQYRPSCDVTAALLASAADKRLKSLMTSVVTRMIETDPAVTLPDIYNAVRDALVYSNDDDIRTLGGNVTEKDVVCIISTEFPEKQIFDYLSLASFRPSCAAVSEDEFKALKQTKLITENVNFALNMCESYSYCPCISNISRIIRNNVGVTATESYVKKSIIQLRPNLTSYCGTTGCSCINLS